MRKGFTLIEILVVVSIIGILMALSIFGLQGARESARDARRKSDLEEIRAGIELYKSDCDRYPAVLPQAGDPLVGDGSKSSCLANNTYIAKVPDDPLPGSRSYYYSSDGRTYVLCASLENGGTDVCSGSCGLACNYKIVNP